MKLWKATVTVSVVIAAAEEPSGFEIEEAVTEGAAQCGVDEFRAEEITRLSELPAGWDGSEIPFGEECDGGSTIAEILAETATTRRQEAWHKPMPNQKELPL